MRDFSYFAKCTEEICRFDIEFDAFTGYRVIEDQLHPISSSNLFEDVARGSLKVEVANAGLRGNNNGLGVSYNRKRWSQLVRLEAGVQRSGVLEPLQRVLIVRIKGERRAEFGCGFHRLIGTQHFVPTVNMVGNDLLTEQLAGGGVIGAQRIQFDGAVKMTQSVLPFVFLL